MPLLDGPFDTSSIGPCLPIALAGWLIIGMTQALAASEACPLFRDLALLTDPQGLASIDDIAQAEEGRFTPLPVKGFSRGCFRVTHWVRFTLVAPPGEFILVANQISLLATLIMFLHLLVVDNGGFPALFGTQIASLGIALVLGRRFRALRGVQSGASHEAARARRMERGDDQKLRGDAWGANSVGQLGLGLGLYLSQRLAAAMDGALHLDRQQSCRFCATLSFPFGEEVPR